MCLGVLQAAAEGVRFHNEENDTLRINQILAEEWGKPDAGNVARIGKMFLGTTYEANTLEGDGEEVLTVNLDEFDCTTFVETVLALAYTAAEHRRSWRDFVDNLEHLRYRNGRNGGYVSRLHYPSEWVVDNSSRGMLKEVTGEMPGARHNVKTLDFMSRNARLYTALSDSSNLAGIRKMETGLSNHRYPVVKNAQVKDKVLAPYVKEGDVALLTTSKPGLDVSHIGIIVIEDGKLHLLHASSREKKVCVDKLTIEEYFRRFRNEGIRIVRLTVD